MKTNRKHSEELKSSVKAKYSQIIEQSDPHSASSCCGSDSDGGEVYSVMSDDYNSIEGYNPEADLGLGCGLPTRYAHIKEGDTVIDLGAGAGNDCFVARHETGATGKVLGIDFSEAMINKARSNAEKLGYNNVEFRYGDLEELPVSDGLADVVVSNCVLNLVPDKQKVFSEIHRVLKPGGHFSISDIVLAGELPEALREDAEMYAGCVAGAIQKETYLGYIKELGFEQITLQNEKHISLPDDILRRYLTEDAMQAFSNSSNGIFSITVYGQKPGGAEENTHKSGQGTAKNELSILSTGKSGCC